MQASHLLGGLHVGAEQNSAELCCAVLCCAVLCCAVLCCAVLCCAVLCCAVLCCGSVVLAMLPHHWQGWGGKRGLDDMRAGQADGK